MQGEVVSYTWNPLNNVAGLLPWLVLAGALVLFKENRRAAALWILLPVVAMRLFWFGFVGVTDMPSDANALLTMLLDSLLIGMTVNWLLAERIGRRHRFVTWLLAWGVFGVVFLSSLASMSFSSDTMQLSIICGISVAILMVSLPLAGFACRRRHGAIRFFLWMGIWILLTTGILYSALIMIYSIIYSMPTGMMLMQVVVITLVYSGILLAGWLPFHVILAKNRFWQQRFEAVFGYPLGKAKASDEVQRVEIQVDLPAHQSPMESEA